MKKNKLIKNIKLYNIIMSNFWLLITTCLTGIIIGYFLNKNSDNENNHYMLISIIIFSVIGIANFFIHLIKEINNLNKDDKVSQDENFHLVQNIEKEDDNV